MLRPEKNNVRAQLAEQGLRVLSQQMQGSFKTCAFQANTLVSFQCIDPCWHMSVTIDVLTLEEAFIAQDLPQTTVAGPTGHTLTQGGTFSSRCGAP